MDNRDVEPCNGMYATIGRMCQLLCKNDCVADAEEWSKEI